jgi:transcriptional regulator with AAA-type ATPase domain
MESIVLTFRGEPLRVFEVRGRPLEVGSGPGCDVVVHDPDVPARALLVREGPDGLLEALDLVDGERTVRLASGVEVALGARHAIARAPALEVPRSVELSLATEPIALAAERPSGITLVIGRGREARRLRLRGAPLTVGSDPGCDLVLADRTVSAVHCRIEPDTSGAWVRDLASRNGTWLDGVRTALGRLAPGSRLRLGRTELFVIDEGRAGDARSDGLVAASPPMIELLGAVERLAKVPYPVLVTGPSGAGKEGIARALHGRGPRRDAAFVPVNAAAIPRDLVESELFGHEKGAFTGAESARRGVFEQADGGTLFLDEVGELTLAVQARLLRVLESWTVRRVGGEGERRVDVRLVCATHRDLRTMVARGAFRADLYYRLVQLRLEVPPLAERPEDVRALAVHFLEGAASTLGARELSSDALEALVAYGWPGNVRELRSVVLAAATESAGVVQRQDVLAAIRTIAGPEAAREISPLGARSLVEQHGSISAAARAIGVARTTLRDRLHRAGGKHELDAGS